MRAVASAWRLWPDEQPKEKMMPLYLGVPIAICGCIVFGFIITLFVMLLWYFRNIVVQYRDILNRGMKKEHKRMGQGAPR